MTVNIEVMKDLEHVRSRHTMYCDSVDHASKEAIDNVIDEFQANACANLGIALNTSTNEIIIADSGRGIPVDLHETEKISQMAVVFSKLHSSGKYQNRDINKYQNTIGLNGVGVKITSATSEYFEAYTKKKKDIYKCIIEKGVLKKSKKDDILGVQKVDSFPQHPLSFPVSTLLKYKPDPQVFGAKYSKINPEYLIELCEALQFLCAGLDIELHIDDNKNQYKSNVGITGLLKKTESKIFELNNGNINVALFWDQESGDEILSFVNCQKTKDGGAHVNALKSAITEAFGEQGKPVASYLKEGLHCALHIKLADPLFQGQNKHRLLNPEASEIVSKNLTRNLELFLSQNSELKDQLLQRALLLKKAHDSYKKDKEALKSLPKKSKYVCLPDKLIAAPDCEPHLRELFLCEGASASGPLVKARTRPLYQEIYQLKGKITNASRQEMKKVLANPDVLGLIQAIGCGILEDCDPKKSRVGKILLLPDSDVDGAHISALLVSFFITYMAPIVEAGMLYQVRSPLYVASYKEHHWYGKGLNDIQAKKDLMKKIPENLKDKIIINRFKGHGAASAEDIKEYALGSKRDIERIILPSSDSELVDKLMGEDSSARKELLAIDF